MGAIGTFLCPALLTGAFFALGLAAGFMAVRQTPSRQTQAIIGIAGNVVGLVVLVVLFVGAAAYSSTR
jgi:hypothetical protein